MSGWHGDAPRGAASPQLPLAASQRTSTSTQAACTTHSRPQLHTVCVRNTQQNHTRTRARAQVRVLHLGHHLQPAGPGAAGGVPARCGRLGEADVRPHRCVARPACVRARTRHTARGTPHAARPHAARAQPRTRARGAHRPCTCTARTPEHARSQAAWWRPRGWPRPAGPRASTRSSSCARATLPPSTQQRRASLRATCWSVLMLFIVLVPPCAAVLPWS